MSQQYTLYKSDISYFSGKLEAYMRYKEIPHRLVDCNQKTLEMIARKTGTQKMPAIEMDNGQWLYDTTPMIQWLENQHPQNPVFPQDPALGFLALLIEDYGDEWLWRPAMWWRWVPKISRVSLGRRIASEMISPHLAMPIGFYFGQRQLNQWLWKDGVDKQNASEVRDMLYHELDFLEAIFTDQPFMLGSHPSIADFGYFGSMFRHFNNDPVSGEVMRRRGPKTNEWIARLWSTSNSELAPTIDWHWPSAPYWQPLLRRIARDYLPYLHQNALAFSQHKERFDFTGESLQFKGTVTTHYRVWCRQELQREFSELSAEQQQRIEALFADVGGLAHLHEDGIIESGLGAQFELPIDPNSVKKKPSIRQKIFGQPRN